MFTFTRGIYRPEPYLSPTQPLNLIDAAGAVQLAPGDIYMYIYIHIYIYIYRERERERESRYIDMRENLDT